MNLESQIFITEKAIEAWIEKTNDRHWTIYAELPRRLLMTLFGDEDLADCMKHLEELKKMRAAEGQIPYQHSREILR